jgi:hypothetical protein
VNTCKTCRFYLSDAEYSKRVGEYRSTANAFGVCVKRPRPEKYVRETDCCGGYFAGEPFSTEERCGRCLHFEPDGCEGCVSYPLGGCGMTPPTQEWKITVVHPDTKEERVTIRFTRYHTPSTRVCGDFQLLAGARLNGIKN